MAASTALIDELRAALGRVADPGPAPGMQAYMKSEMPFLGVRVPVVRRLTRAVEAEHHWADAAELEDTVRTLWDEADFREERYAATALLDTRAARGLRRPEQLALLHHLVVDGAWWDHVDEVSHRVGDLLLGWPGRIRPQVLRWATSESRWLRRSAIICQLGHDLDAMDLDLLRHAVEANASDTDFFVRKAIGWALRDLARRDPGWVLSFVDTHDLSPLSRREAVKHL